ncbi:MAG: HAD family hydrolase [Blautia sp.]|nr:HAD family hydrolase [Blautia sp.]
MRKAVFFDIDRTIWNWKNEIPPSTVEAIRGLRKNGNLAFMCTGRTRGFIRHPALLGIGFDGIVSGCGTMIEYNGETVFYHELEKDLVEWTVRTVRKYGFKPILEGRKHLYLELEDFENDMYGRKVIKDMGDDLRSIDCEWGKWEVSKLSCATDTPDREKCLSELSEYYDFLVHDPTVAEIVPKGFDKATGMKDVCEMLGIDMADTIAFGDSENDREMLLTAGIGVAMGDGAPQIRAIADYVTKPMEEGGIYHACRELGLLTKH